MSTIDTSTWNPDANLNTEIEGIPLNSDASIAQTWQIIRILMAAFKGDTSAIQALMVPFSGGTASADGASGFVPAPEAGDEDKLLKGDGTWSALDASQIPVLDASKIASGTIDLARIPAGAIERLIPVTDQAARFALTTDAVQLGDVVKETDTGLLYFVTDTAHLDSDAGYTVFTAGAASAVPWSGVTGKPSSFTPSSHTHGNITNDGKVGTTSGKPLITGSGGAVTAGSFGNASGTFCEGNDSRLSDARTPTAHASSATTYGVSSASNYGHAMASSTTPKAAGTAAVGSETAKFARGDHVHPAQISVSGNAGSATEFASAQTVALTGDVTGSASSKAGWSVATTLANSGVSAGRYTSVDVDAKGRVTAGNVKHSYTTAANAAKNWYRIANANTSQTDTTKPIHAQFILTAYNASYGAGYYERWFVNAGVFGGTAHIVILGNTTAPFSHARVLYENTIADLDANDRPAIDIYLNYQLANGTTKIEIEEVYNSGWTFVADGQISASSVPTGFENTRCGVHSNGVEWSTYSDWSTYTQLQRSNFTANFTLADNNTYRARVLNCTGTITVTVPSINSTLSWFIIKNFNTTSGVITIHPSTTSVLIDGSNADITLQPGEYIMIHSKAANAYTIVFDGRNIGINKTNSTEDANSLYSVTAGTKIEYYTTTNGGTTLTNVPAAVNTTLESRTLRRLSATDWNVEQICHNTSGLYYRKGSNSGWTPWKAFAFTDSDITGNAATASAVAWSGVTNKPTTLAGYGITDAKISNGTITLGSNAITPLTSVPSHNQASNTINAMTGYSKPSSTSAIATTDSLNTAVGKLEKGLDGKIELPANVSNPERTVLCADGVWRDISQIAFPL